MKSIVSPPQLVFTQPSKSPVENKRAREEEPAGNNLQKRAKYSPGASPSPVQLSQASQGGDFSPDNEEDF